MSGYRPDYRCSLARRGSDDEEKLFLFDCTSGKGEENACKTGHCDGIVDSVGFFVSKPTLCIGLYDHDDSLGYYPIQSFHVHCRLLILLAAPCPRWPSGRTGRSSAPFYVGVRDESVFLFEYTLNSVTHTMTV